jgi:hypothetical protein
LTAWWVLIFANIFYGLSSLGFLPNKRSSRRCRPQGIGQIRFEHAVRTSA